MVPPSSPSSPKGGFARHPYRTSSQDAMDILAAGNGRRSSLARLPSFAMLPTPSSYGEEPVVTVPPIGSTSHNPTSGVPRNQQVHSKPSWIRRLFPLCGCDPSVDEQGEDGYAYARPRNHLNEASEAAERHSHSYFATSPTSVSGSYPLSRTSPRKDLVFDDSSVALQLRGVDSPACARMSPSQWREQVPGDSIAGSLPNFTVAHHRGSSPSSARPFQLPSNAFLPTSLSVPSELLHNERKDEDRRSYVLHGSGPGRDGNAVSPKEGTTENRYDTSPGVETPATQHPSTTTVWASQDDGKADHTDTNARELAMLKNAKARYLDMPSSTVDSAASAGSIYSTNSGPSDILSPKRSRGPKASESFLSPAQSRTSTQLEQSPFINEILSRFPRLGRPMTPDERAATPHPPGFMEQSSDDSLVDPNESSMTAKLAHTPSAALDTPPPHRPSSPVKWTRSDPADTPQMRIRRHIDDQMQDLSDASPASSASMSTLHTPSPREALLLQSDRARHLNGDHLVNRFADIGALGLRLDASSDDEDEAEWQNRFKAMVFAERMRSDDDLVPDAHNLRKRVGSRASLSSAASGSYHTASKTVSLAGSAYHEGAAGQADETLDHPSWPTPPPLSLSGHLDTRLAVTGRSSPLPPPPNLPLPPVPAGLHLSSSQSSLASSQHATRSARTRTRTRTPKSSSQGQRESVGVAAIRSRKSRANSNQSASSARTVRFAQQDDFEPQQQPQPAAAHHGRPTIAAGNFI